MSIEHSKLASRQRAVPIRVKFVLARLALFARPDGSEARPSLERLAYETGVNKRTVIRSLKDALKLGWLQVERPARGNKPTCYRLTLPFVPEWKSADSAVSCTTGAVHHDAPQDQATAVHNGPEAVQNGNSAVHFQPGSSASCSHPIPDPSLDREKDRSPAAPLFFSDKRTNAHKAVDLPQWTPRECKHEPPCPDQFVCRGKSLEAVRRALAAPKQDDTSQPGGRRALDPAGLEGGR